MSVEDLGIDEARFSELVEAVDGTYRLTPEGWDLFCPECGAVAAVATRIFSRRYHCNECGTSWAAGDRDDCARCEKTLGRADILCYTCQTELQEGST